MLKKLPESPLDIIGDIHGEIAALKSLLFHLGYSDRGHNSQGRKLVFVGDLCDRGPDSPAVIELVRRIVEEGSGYAILGNHELNLLREEKKDGNDWFWDLSPKNEALYEPYTRLPSQLRTTTRNFFDQLPLALEREDIRIVHATWHKASVQKFPEKPGIPISILFNKWEAKINNELDQAGLLASSEKELNEFSKELHDPDHEPPMLSATGTCEEQRQMGNPIRVLTSGIERLAERPFFSGQKWRFAERVSWWDEYDEKTPVIVGHYWRRFRALDRTKPGKGDADLFASINPTDWHGLNRNVFCIDYSVGARFLERHEGLKPGTSTHLAALRWPERTLMFDNGDANMTTLFNDTGHLT